MSEPLTLGLLFSSTRDLYEQAIYKGVCTTAQKAGANLICFTSGALRAHRGFEMQRNVLFDLVDQRNVDGLLISGTLAHPISKEETQVFFQRFEHIPRVSIALSLPGVPSVMVDNRQAICDMVTHLVQQHGYRRLAFIRGPHGHGEAEERYRFFCETLQKFGLQADPNLVVQGDYTFHSGASAMRELLQRRDADFEAVVSANDSMALGAMEVFRAAGKEIPRDAAFTGFDNTLAGRFDESPLTSIHQNVYDQAILAVELLLEQIAGHTIALKNTSPARLVVRRSCGCTGFKASTLAVSILPQPDWANTLRRELPHIEQVLWQNMSHMPQAMVQAWGDAWLEALIAALSHQQAQGFLDALAESQRAGFDLGIELSVWNQALAAFFHLVQACLGDPRLKQAASQIELESQIHIGITAEHLEYAHQIQLERQNVILGETSEGLLTSFDLEGVLQVLSTDFPRLNVRACFLSLFEESQKPAERARLIFGWQQGNRIPLPPEGVVFPSKQLVPSPMRAYLSGAGWVVEALYSKEDRLGFMLLEVHPQYVSVCHDLRVLISGALQGVLLLDQRRRFEEQLLQSKGQLEALINRLETSNRELESFAYSVSHDLRSPLRSINGFAQILVQDYAQCLDENGQRFLRRIYESALRMDQLIDDLLAFSRFSRHEIRRVPIDMNALAWQLVEELQPQYANRHIDWQIHDLLPCSADQSLMKQVLLNLMENAIKYTRPRQQTVIEIYAYTQDNEIIYAVRDNGVGFDMEYADKLFAVFQRLHGEGQFEGTGVGLAIVQRIIHRHNGRVWAQSHPGEGATFFFVLGPPNL